MNINIYEHSVIQWKWEHVCVHIFKMVYALNVIVIANGVGLVNQKWYFDICMYSMGLIGSLITLNKSIEISN